MFIVYFYNDVELDYADTELTPRSTSPLTMFVSFVQIMAEKLGQNLVGRLSNKRKFLVSGKNLLCLWPVTAGEVSAGDVS